MEVSTSGPFDRGWCHAELFLPIYGYPVLALVLTLWMLPAALQLVLRCVRPRLSLVPPIWLLFLLIIIWNLFLAGSLGPPMLREFEMVVSRCEGARGTWPYLL